MKGVTLWTEFLQAGLSLSSFSSFCKKWTFQCEVCGLKKNKTGTSKVGAISKAQKAQKTFFEKKLEIFDFFSFRKCRIVPKNVKGGTLWALLTYILLQNIKKTRKGDSFETLKNFRKKSHNAEKNRRGAFSLVRFCS